MRISEWVRQLASHPGVAPTLETLRASCEWQSVSLEARPVLLAAWWLSQNSPLPNPDSPHPPTPSPRTSHRGEGEPDPTPQHSNTASPKVLIVTSSYERSLQWQAKLALCGVPESIIHQLHSGISALFEDASPEHVALSERIGALRALVEDEPCIVIGSPQAALERTLPADILRESFIHIKPGDGLDPERFLRQLVGLGYEHQEPVRQPGQFSRRGGIVDVYASGHDLPIRIELFGDVIESIRQFDPNSQRSVGTIPAFELVPSRETIYPPETVDMRGLIMDALEREMLSLSGEAAFRLEELIAGDAEALSQHQYFDRLDLYRPLLFPDSGSAIDLLGDGGMLILDEPLELDAIGARAEEDLGAALAARAERGEILHSTANDYMLPPEHLSNAARVVSMSSMNALPDWLSLPTTVLVNAQSLEPYRGRPDALGSTLKTWQKQDFELVVGTDQPTRATTVLGQVGISAGEGLYAGNLAGGFVMPDLKLALLTDAELFGVARLRLPQKRFLEGAPIATVLDLKPGDYVVHINFGIGIFRGLAKRVIEDVEKEFLFIEYAAPDKLFVPADQLDRIQKYLNPADTHPKLNKLTGGEWQKTLSKAKEDAKAFAADLVKLYAERKAVQRRPFAPDTPFQAEVEATFPWIETPTQMSSINEVKRDMQQDWPMDRLVCGDVGFGKTEVAIRAAFKAVESGRQVAILCPTTILSEQHYRNFVERLGGFGVKIELLNRYTHTSARRKAMEGISAGQVDITIGTHALLGKEIHFKELGLLVIDEEQRFGVKHKEVLKKMRTEVDVLTMSATPIPRTLSMSLMDIRQMSLITDPPPGRLPIRTFVRPYSQEVTREAILRELARGGQVYYVYNRVESIQHIAEKLRKIVPSARIGVAHGQMTESEIEPIMVAFIHGEVDVLLSTTIIESGLDIPNANTLIVENADRLGLAQLYQLRGRVGRSDRQAYAYLLYQSGKDLSSGALQRLQALQEFSALGSGYSLAFRDLQIRGAGELLGAKQSGSMASVGYELYQQLINEAVGQLKAVVEAPLPTTSQLAGTSHPKSGEGGPDHGRPLPVADIPVIALLPETYIRDQAQRLYYYQQIMGSRTPERLAEVVHEVEDRYGHPTDPAKNAFEIMRLRMAMRDLGFEKLDAKGGRVAVNFKDKQSISPRVFSILGKRNREAYVTREQLIWPFSGDPIEAVRRVLDEFESALRQMDEEREMLGV